MTNSMTCDGSFKEGVLCCKVTVSRECWRMYLLIKPLSSCI